MSSSDPTVTRENDGAIAVLRISNPKRRNAFSPEVRGALVGHMNDIATDDAIRSIIIT